jgi:hypothetical protein
LGDVIRDRDLGDVIRDRVFDNHDGVVGVLGEFGVLAPEESEE